MTVTNDSNCGTRHKDPLQATNTAYEVLGIDCRADRTAIETAFKRSFHKPDAVEARRTLLDKTRRDRHDLTLYDAEVLRTLGPCPLLDESLLFRSNRKSTVSWWEGQFKRDFPSILLAHVLAVQWYWWTVLEEERFILLLMTAPEPAEICSDPMTCAQLVRMLRPGDIPGCGDGDGRTCWHGSCQWREDCGSVAPSLQEMWEKVIAYWCMIERAAKVGDMLHMRHPEETNTLVTQFVDSLEHRLLDRMQQFATILGKRESRGDTSSVASAREASSPTTTSTHVFVEMYQSLVSKLRMERRTAEAVSSAGVRTSHGKVCCGVMLLRHVGMLASVRKQVEVTLGRAPMDERLQDLHGALSPYSAIALLLESKEPHAALAAIEALPSRDQGAEDVKRLRLRALHLLGKEHISLGEFQEGLRCWGQALPLAEELGVGEKLRSEITATAFAEAQRRQQFRRDEAVELLDLALEFVDDKKLTVTLANVLAERGIDRFLRGREKAEGIPSEAQLLLRQANSAAERGDWDAAIEALRRALSTPPPEDHESSDRAEGLESCRQGMSDLNRAAALGSKRAKEQSKAGKEAQDEIAVEWRDRFRKNLAWCLGNRGIGKANQVVEISNKAVQAHEERAEALIASLSPTSGPYRCGYPGCYSTPEGSWTLNGGITVTLCPVHAQELQAQLASPKPDEAALGRLQEAEDDLLEASEIDPSNTHVRTNLASTRDLLRQFGLNPRKHSSRYRPAKPAKQRRARPRRETPKKASVGGAPAASERPQESPAPAPTKSGLAIACLVLGLLSLFLGPLAGVPALFCGHGALRTIAKQPGMLEGRGIAKAGLVLAYIALVAWLAVIFYRFG